MIENEIKLTQFSKASGCGCKMAPQVLKDILSKTSSQKNYEQLLVGNGTNDDAAAWDMGDGNLLISTTDFFTPIVNDAFNFGAIAAANAISDVYAMGANPIFALAILGWPVEKLSNELATQVINGAKSICNVANIPLAGGHSIDSDTPIFGLVVNGIVKKENLKQNSKATLGDYIFITKPIGSGILSAALKKEKITIEDESYLINQLTTLNKIGKELSLIEGVTALTDITGFGLAGHLIEICEAANLSATINFSKIPLMQNLDIYLSQRLQPDASFRNWNAYSKTIKLNADVPFAKAFAILPDPQTNGGLLITVKENHVNTVKKLLSEKGLSNFLEPIGQLIEKTEHSLQVNL